MKSENRDDKESRSWAGRMVGGVEGHVQGRVVAGLLQLVPLIVTVIVLLFIINKADGYVRQLPFVEGEPWDVTGIGIAAVVVAFYLIGLLTIFRFGRWIMDFIGEILLRVPVVKVIYRLMLQVTNVVASEYGFSRVVFVEWPREGMIAMGFVTGRILSKDKDHSLVTVYIPTVPNPTSGNMAFVHEDDVMETDLSVGCRNEAGIFRWVRHSRTSRHCPRSQKGRRCRCRVLGRIPDRHAYEARPGR